MGADALCDGVMVDVIYIMIDVRQASAAAGGVGLLGVLLASRMFGSASTCWRVALACQQSKRKLHMLGLLLSRHEDGETPLLIEG
jgi:xanthosine utilization system XapX-like protein